MKRFIQRSLAKKIIAVIWFISATLFIPWAYYFRLSTTPDGLVNCREFWPSVAADRFFFLGVVTLLVYTVPLLFMAYCYFSIILRIWMRVHNEESDSGQQESRALKDSVMLYAPTTEALSDREHETGSDTCYYEGNQHIESNPPSNCTATPKFVKM